MLISFLSPSHSDSAANIPVILLPGLDGTGELLTDLANAISCERRVHLVTYPVEGGLGYNELTDYVLGCLPVDEPFVILGESFSGPIAIEIAARLEQARGLILASSFARHPLPKFLAPLSSLLRSRWIPRNIIAAALLGRTGTPQLKAQLMCILEKVPDATLQHRAAAALRVDRLGRLREVTAPVLCLHGRYDRLVWMGAVNEIVSAQPQCRICRLDAAHMLLETHPQQAARAIDVFCRDLSL